MILQGWINEQELIMQKGTDHEKSCDDYDFSKEFGCTNN